MNAFLAIVLICARAVSPDACTRDTALDVYVEPVGHETECLLVGQPKAASIIGASEADGRYPRIDCRRIKR
jgi:hypothetical protein